MIFVFDIDDTISETDIYSEKYILDYFKNNNLPHKQIAKTVRFAEEKFDWDISTAKIWYKEHGDDMMFNFPCKPNAVNVINTLHKNGHKIIFATARSENWHTNPREVTINWLEKNNIKYDKLYTGRLDKEKICEEENADVFVDDDLEITERVIGFLKSKNGHVFLANTEYNELFPTPKDVIRIKSLNELLTFFKI